MNKNKVFKLKLISIFILSLLFVFFVSIIVASQYIKLNAENIKKESFDLASEQIERFTKVLSEYLTSRDVNDLENLRNDPGFKTTIKFYKPHSDEILEFDITDNTGKFIIHWEKNGQSKATEITGGFATDFDLATSKDQILKMNVTRKKQDVKNIQKPLKANEAVIGQIRYKLSTSSQNILNKINETHKKIITQTVTISILAIIVFLIAFLVLWQIFTHHLELQRENERLDRMAYIGSLASNLAHEIRNPLNAINVNLDIVKEEIEDPRDDSKNKSLGIINTVKTEVKMLNTMMTNFLSYAKPIKKEKEDVDLKVLLNDVVDFFQPEFHKNHIRCDLKVESNDAVIEGAYADIRQIISNIIINSVQAMYDYPRHLSITLSQNDNQAVLKIIDTGKGISKEDLPRVFEAFYTTKPGGSGFGLAIAQRIINDHNGEIKIESEPNKGTIVIISLPLKKKVAI